MPARRIIGVDVGGTKLLAGAVDPALGVHRRTQRTVTGLDQRSLLAVMVGAVEEVREATGSDVEAVGFGIPVLMDQRSGRAVMGVNTPLAEISLADAMAERLGLPVFVDNDGNAAAVAEHLAGAAHGASEAIVLTLGTGIAGGLILRDELYRGALGTAGEIGHVTIDFDGPWCEGNCRNRGCAEMFASGTALAREARLLATARPDSALARAVREGRDLVGPLVTELAHDGDAAAIEAIALIGSRLGILIASLVNIFNPQVVVIGGGVIAAGELLLGPARACATSRLPVFLAENLSIEPARFGVEAGMVGAAALAYDQLARAATA